MNAQPQIDYAKIDDLGLARLCGKRDREALRQVITANNQRLFRAAWSILRDRIEAEEAVQTGYLNAFAAIDTFEGRSSLSTWLTRIIVNAALARLRIKRRRHELLEEEGISVFDIYRHRLAQGSVEPQPDEALAREQLRLLIERAVARLPDGFRSVFVLRDIEGLSIEETAEALDLAPATVKTRLHRARAKLQHALAPEVEGALTGSFPFAGADCAALTERVLARLG
ncbi:MAG TPA: RNA polymerase sigma factor [Sphingomicrobium sp.]|nr:RNA polymerase sigma factor [Sphingomicrobium sp.]